MNTEITKNKNIYADNSLINRILRLEKILQQVLQLTANTDKPNSAAGKITNSEQDNLLSDLISPQASVSNSNNAEQSIIFPIKNTVNNNQPAKNNMALSRGQIIAELALAIARASRRNS